jgi:hypothetical protein
MPISGHKNSDVYSYTEVINHCHSYQEFCLSKVSQSNKTHVFSLGGWHDKEKTIAMKNLVFILVILSVAISATFADIECYDCGLSKPCSDDPFDGSITDKVNCSVGCLKIDGLDSENNRKLARGCGNLTTTVCEENKEHFGLTGKLCSCTKDLCNGETWCYYCGLRKPCDDPFDGSITDKVTCKVGCLKIDGLDSENNTKQVRGCGDLTTTVCEENM